MQDIGINLDLSHATNGASPDSDDPGLRRSRLAPALVAIYRLLSGHRRWKVARLVCSALMRFEGRAWHSATVRDLLSKHHGVTVGAYSYGDCLVPGLFPPGVVVGRYTSIAAGVRVFNQNHPLGQLSMHPFFYDPQFGVVPKNPLPRKRLAIGHDVWIGQNALITPGCSRVGIGAVIGAGAVVTKDVDDFAIVAGNPAKVIRYRFPEEIRAAILKSRWWELPLERVRERLDLLTRSLTPADVENLIWDKRVSSA